MITIPQPIKYDKDLHFSDIITIPLDPNDLIFIKSVLADLKRDHAEAYIVYYGNGRVAICRKGLQPVITPTGTQNKNFFALKNMNNGKIIVAGKNLRRPESLLPVLKGMTKKNPIKQQILNRTELTVKERCSLVHYELLKQAEPFL
ncbi:MAG: hypothetical protein GWP19_08125 [Planctomycetia bacterium]|nr:hypothetical protein [Planctomycetia bacterium]